MDQNQAETTRKVGKTVLFCGTQTVLWSLDQFRQAARFARSLGVDSLSVKCYDGSIRWYDGQGGIAAIRDAIKSEGCGFVPYQYLYGEKFGAGALDQELAALAHLMELGEGCVCADLEAEWNGHPDWADRFNAAMRPVPGELYLTTWADPAQQDWMGVLAHISPCVNAYVPQQYTNWLAAQEGQFPHGANIEPAVDLSYEFSRNNDPVGIARTAVAHGHSTVWIWEIGFAEHTPQPVRDIVSVMAAVSVPTVPGTPPPPTPTPTPTPTPAPPPPPPPPNPWPGLPTHHTIVNGDTLSGLAAHYYHNADLWPKIYAANQRVIGSNPDMLHINTVLIIPVP